MKYPYTPAPYNCSRLRPPVIQTTGMDSRMDSKEQREDGYTTVDDINLNVFFNEGPDLKIVEIEQKIYVENGEYVDHIEKNKQEETQVTPVIILPDQQVQNVCLKKMFYKMAHFNFNFYSYICGCRYKPK